MTELEEVLARCPPSDEAQRAALQREWKVDSLADLDGAYVFGAARLGAGLAATLRSRGLTVAGFVDNDPGRWGTTHAGLPVLAPAHADTARALIVASKHVKAIMGGIPAVTGRRRPIPHYVLPLVLPSAFDSPYHALSAQAVSGAADEIRAAYALFADPPSRRLFLDLLTFRITLEPAWLPDPEPSPYFPAGGFWRLDPHESFVDVGACGGDTLADFLRHAPAGFERYWALEPDPENYRALLAAILTAVSDRVRPLCRGASDRAGTLTFAGGLGGESRMSAAGGTTVQVDTLDAMLGGARVTTVKVDVEGFEAEVLRGARATIAGQAPKLALSVYHRLADLWEIPRWVEGCRPGYRMFLRHHTEEVYDTVLYCVAPDQRAT